MFSAQTISQMVDTVLAWPADTRIMLLAPLVADRKGGMPSCSSSSRPRASRACGSTARSLSFDPTPKLAKNHKHTIEVVVDRLKVRPDASSAWRNRSRRPAEWATVARLWFRWMMKRRNRSFFVEVRLPDLRLHSLAELEPRLFSFNSPMGACPTCDGSAKSTSSSPAASSRTRAVARQRRDQGWDRRTIFYFQMPQGLAAHYGFRSGNAVLPNCRKRSDTPWFTAAARR